MTKNDIKCYDLIQIELLNLKQLGIFLLDLESKKNGGYIMDKKDLAKIALSSVFSIGSLNISSEIPTVHVDLKKRYVGNSKVDLVRIPTFSESLDVNFGSVGTVICDANKELIHG